ncbi:MAG: DUF2651 family protein [Clostridia bacterium]|nr:DUF2651 family protein [Clostridia bacterium]
MTNILLLFFAIPIAIIILSIIFETIINCPIKIAGIVFAIFLIVTFAAFDETFLIFTILYTILAFIVAWITKQWTNNQSDCQEESNCSDDSNDSTNSNNTNNTNNCRCGCNNARRRLL